MLDRKTLVIGAASLAVGVAIGGVFLGNAPHAETSSAIQAERDFMDFTMPDLARPDENSGTNEPDVEPPASQTEKDFMDFTMPDLSQSQGDEETTRHGCVKPARPQWAVNRSPQEADNAVLLKAIYDMRRYENIIETNSCPCDIEHPSWNSADQEYNQVATGKDRAEIQDLGGEVLREVARLLKPSLDICREQRGR